MTITDFNRLSALILQLGFKPLGLIVIEMRNQKEWSDATSDPERSASESPTDVMTPPQKKKRKPAYYVRKETIDALRNQVKSLQKQLTYARATSTVSADLEIARHKADIGRHHCLIAGLESLLSSHTQVRTPKTTPLVTCIHLPKGDLERDHVLQSLHSLKLDAAYRFMIERTRFLDLQIHHVFEEMVYPLHEDLVSVRFTVSAFDSRYSLGQVYDALKYFLANEEEVLIKDKAEGEQATYENSEKADGFQYGQVRLSATLSDSLEVASNSVTFLGFRNAKELSEDAPGYAIAASDFVDRDDADIRPHKTTVVKRLTSAILMRETPTTKGPIVSLCKWEHTRFQSPTIQPLTKKQIENLHTMTTSHWDVMMRVMNARLKALW